MLIWYPLLPGYDVNSFMNQVLLAFTELLPGFETFWHIDLDVRYTGQWYNLSED